MVFIITSPFPFHFLYKLVQVTCCVPERADQRQPAEMHLQNPSLWSSFITPYSAFPFLQPTHSSSPSCLLHLHFFLLAFPLFLFLHYFYFFPFCSCPSSFFPFFPSPLLRIASWFFFLPSTFFSPYIILLVLSGSHCYFLTLDHRRAHIPKAHQNSVWKTTTGEKKGEKESEVFMWLNQLFHGWLAFGSKELWL